MGRERNVAKRIRAFALKPGHLLAGKYQVVDQLGSGWEGEVYKIVELRTGVERAAKLFYPHRNEADRTSRYYAKKLHKLRQCTVLIQYHTEERICFAGTPVTVLVSEYVEGELLSAFLKRLPGRRLHPFQALHLLYALSCGMETIHLLGEYHGDLHSENIIVSHFGLGFDLKLVDFFQLRDSKNRNRQADICDMVYIFHESLGGARTYAKQPQAVKYICCGLKRGLILKKFRTASHLREHLESMEWS